MSAARRGQLLKIDLAGASLTSSRDLPPIAALFQIIFDIKAGYTIVWKRAINGVELEGVVEFKSLPSGLHMVKEDLIYFVHDQYAGISAFVNEPRGEVERNALMLAVGVLVPLSYGRLGRSWRHARNLKDIARELARDSSRTELLEDFWEAHKLHDEIHMPRPDSPFDSPSSLRFQKSPWIMPTPTGSKGHTRNRSASDAAALVPAGQTLTPYHPALSLLEFLHMFGPLVFPIFRAALARKRILILTKAPVEQSCNFVYDISVLSNIPIAVADLLPAEPSRLKPLFTIGVHDIPLLEAEAKKHADASISSPITEDTRAVAADGNLADDGSWVACTTDGVLYLKENLYDLFVSMPQPYAKDAAQRVWPTLESSRHTPIKASQRDLRRYRALRRGLNRYHPGCLSRQPGDDHGPNSPDAEDPNRQLDPDIDDDAQDEKTAEPLSWSELAYSSFMWWASAGEKRQDLDDQEMEDSEGLLRSTTDISTADCAVDQDDADDADDDENTPLVETNGSPGNTRPNRSRRKSSMSLHLRPNSATKNTPEMDIIAYFHRLTTRILRTLAELVEESGGAVVQRNPPIPALAGDVPSGPRDGEETDSEGQEEQPVEDNEDDEEGNVFVSSEDMARMGLDEWSERDRDFVIEMMRLYFGRGCEVEGKGLECCGVRIF